MVLRQLVIHRGKIKMGSSHRNQYQSSKHLNVNGRAFFRRKHEIFLCDVQSKNHKEKEQNQLHQK